MTKRLPKHALKKLLDAGSDAHGDDDVPEDALTDIGRYQRIRELGRGGMGVVYEAFDPALQRSVALKVLSASSSLSEASRQRFLREAKAAAKLSHPNIAAVYDATPEYISMQLVYGKPLSELDPGDVRTLVALVRDAALAVHFAHQEGIVHRDLKPQNLMVEEAVGSRPHLYVCDFGLAKETEIDSSLSVSGHILGTPAFMSPEQAAGRGHDVDARSDVYGLGATLYACLGGRPPCEGSDVFAVLKRTIEEDPPRLHTLGPQTRGVSRELETIVHKCLEKDPDRRYQTALFLAGDLDRWLRGEPIQARPPSTIYRLRKFVLRRRTAFAAAAIAALIVLGVLGPVSIRDRAQRVAAQEALMLSERVDAILTDMRAFERYGDNVSSHARHEEGIALCQEFLERTDVPLVWVFLGRLHRAHHDLDEARDAFDRAIELAPELAAVRFERGLVLAEKIHAPGLLARTDASPSERELALSGLRIELAENAIVKNTDRLAGAGHAAWLEGDLERALAKFNELLDIDRRDFKTCLFLSRLHAERDDDDLAQYFAAAAADILRGFGPEYDDRAGLPEPVAAAEFIVVEGTDGWVYDFDAAPGEQLTAARSLGNNGQLDLRRALRLELENDTAGALQSWDVAIHHFADAAKLAPDSLGAYVNRGLALTHRARLLSRLGRATEAAQARQRAGEDYTRALVIDSSSPAVRVNRALLCMHEADLHLLAMDARTANERRAAGLHDLEKALELLPDSGSQRDRVLALMQHARDLMEEEG